MKTNLMKILALVVAKTKGMKCVFFLVSLFSLLLAPQHAQADEYTVGKHFKYDGFEYEVLDPDNRKLSVYGCEKTESSITIPDVIHPSLDQTWDVVEVAGDWHATSSWSKSIKSVIIPNTVTTLGPYCFNGASMEHITLSENIKSIAPEAFLYLGKNMKSFSINGNSEHFKVDDGILYTSDGKELVGVPSNKTFQNDTFIVPDGVEIIRTNAFANNQQIATIHLPTTCTKLERESAHGIAPWADKLKEFTVAQGHPVFEVENGVLYDKNEAALVMFPPQNTNFQNGGFKVPWRIKKIYSYGFFNCPVLTKYIDLNQVNTLERRSIYQLSTLKKLTLSSSLTTIEEDAISDNTNITEYIVENNPNYIAIEDAIYSADGKTLLYFPAGKIGSYVFPSDTKVETLGRLCFSTSHLSSLKIPKSVKKIDDSAIFNMSLLETLTFEESSGLETIEAHGIYHNKSLTQLVLPKTLQEIKYQGIADNIKLKEVIIPNGSELINIHQMAFWNDTNLEHVTFEGSCKLENFGKQAFYGCNNLENFNMPASVKYIGNLAFGDCTKLNTVTFPDDAVITTIGNGAFSTSGITTITLPPSIEIIESEAFRECNALTKVDVSVNANKISPEAFKKCEKLTVINVAKGNETYSSWDGILLTKNKETLVTYPAGKEYKNFVLLPPSLKSIGDYAFYDCKKLENVVIPNKVTSIGQRAFGLCTKLNTVTFLCDEMIDPDNIVKELNRSSFDDDVLTNNPGDDTRGNITLHVRKELLSDYQNSEFYKKFKGIEPSFIDETSRVGGLNKSKATEEFIKVSDDAVDLLSVVTDDETYVLPTSVTIDNKPYAVKIVGDYLFTARGSNVGKNVKEVVVPGKIEYIGARAFIKDSLNTSTSSSVENVFIIGSPKNEDLLSTTHFKLTAEDLGSSTENRYDEFGTTTKIYVRELALDTFKTAWTNYADNIDYKIPYTQSGTFGTFAREFDVSFSEVNGVNEDNPVTDDPVLLAFTGDGKYHIQGDSYYVHMTSINLGDQKGKDGTYIPAGSGVLIKKYREPDATNGTGIYYQIAESGISPAFVEGNFMKGVTVRKETIEIENGISRFYISGGKLHEMTQPKQFSNHKSYMEISNNDIPAGAKVMLNFIEPGDETETTGIENLMVDENIDDADKVYYNLNGQRVYTPSKGIYILNGKKVIVK